MWTIRLTGHEGLTAYVCETGAAIVIGTPNRPGPARFADRAEAELAARPFADGGWTVSVEPEPAAVPRGWDAV